jgi:phosphopantothenoylcysteine decarboxylase/phosphopantothenate--cysteine ligase
MLSLTNKRILLGITGGIAAYKCAELTRLFLKAGAEVRVAMTKAATEFITPLTMQALSGNRVSLDLLDIDAEAAMGHIELARWADLVIIAPATADFIARVSHGQADDILTTLVLATAAPIAIAPAMNQAMWSNSGTQENLSALSDRGYRIFGPASGEQACGDVGPGRMLEPQQLLQHCGNLFDVGRFASLRLLITGGPTREAIDPVRFISNHSSGKMAFALAQEAAAAGAQVKLVSGPVNLATPDSVSRIDVESAEDMLAAVMDNISGTNVFIGVAAVADYRPKQLAHEKIKKDDEGLTLSLIKSPDIISEVAKLSKGPFTVGFAAETNSIIENGKQKLLSKKLDLLFANNATESFNSDSISLTAITSENEFEIATANKNVVAQEILKLISERINSKSAE